MQCLYHMVFYCSILHSCIKCSYLIFFNLLMPEFISSNGVKKEFTYVFAFKLILNICIKSCEGVKDPRKSDAWNSYYELTLR